MSIRINIVLLILFCLLVGGCRDGYADVTNDPEFGFGEVAYRCFVTKGDFFIIDEGPNEIFTGLTLVPPAAGDVSSDMPDSVEEYLSHPKQYWKESGGRRCHLAGVIPKGTHLTVTNLIQETYGSGGCLPFARFTDGPYKGKLVVIPRLLNNPDWPDAANSRLWTINTKYLASCWVAP